MSVNSYHPSYASRIADWVMMRDAYEGEAQVKAKGTKYLPATPGQVLDGQGSTTNVKTRGNKDYEAYKLRAVFHDFVSDAVESYIGLLHQKPAVIDLPDDMTDFSLKATIDGESLQALLRRLNVEQLVTGRVGMILDLPPNADPLNPVPYIATYFAETVINWNESADHVGVNALQLVVLDETSQVMKPDLEWEIKEQWRVLRLFDQSQLTAPAPVQKEDGTVEARPNPVRVVTVATNPEQMIYAQGVFTEKDSTSFQDALNYRVPVLRGQPLHQIPFVFLNSKDIITSPDNPPLIGLGRLAMAIYRGEADYRQTLFLQGQDTLVTIGGIVDPDPAAESGGAGNDGVRVGAGARLDMNMGGDAKYIGIGSEGLAEQRSCLENDKKQATSKAGQLISPDAGKQESGDALSTRLAAQTATLNQIALSAALALENILKIAAAWMGSDPTKVKVTPNLEFADESMLPADLLALVNARNMGAPMSLQSIHDRMSERGLTKLTLDEELALIAEEDLAVLKRKAAAFAAVPSMAPVPPAQQRSGPQPPANAPQPGK
jgi:hypothetical protein